MTVKALVTFAFDENDRLVGGRRGTRRHVARRGAAGLYRGEARAKECETGSSTC